MLRAKLGFHITNQAGSRGDTAYATQNKSSAKWAPRSAQWRERQQTSTDKGTDMITERETSQIAGRFLARRLNGAIHLLFAAAVALTILGIGLLRGGAQSETLADGSQSAAALDW